MPAVIARDFARCFRRWRCGARSPMATSIIWPISATIAALVMGVRAFWRDIGEPVGMLDDGGSLWQAMKDAASLRYLDGGGVGCVNEDERPSDRRKIYHHLTFYGFLLCFASTTVATLYHYLLAREAPYP